MHHTRHDSGLSLLELLIVLTIVAILASVTIPSYRNYVYKSRRSDAITGLLQLQLAQEAWRARHGVYSTDLVELGRADERLADGKYRLRLESAGPDHWLAVAIPQGPQRGDPCARLAVDESGPVYGGRFAGRRCWNR